MNNALAIEADVIFIQEHRRRAKDIATWRTAARHKGWHGVWSYADTTDKGAASGGVAILVRLGRPIFATPAVNDARFVGAVISWTRRVKMHLYSVYGYDCGKEDAAGKNRAFHRSISQEITRVGRVPWIMGGGTGILHLPKSIWGTLEGLQYFPRVLPRRTLAVSLIGSSPTWTMVSKRHPRFFMMRGSPCTGQ